ncbi:MAG TPA: hypothetical protein VFV57_04445 [Limnobacter sp.]|nr:hypothetical protein [Limnobacter sp.]
MNKRALVYLALTSATLGGAYLYMQIKLAGQSSPDPHAHSPDNHAQSRPSISVRGGQLLTEAVRLQIKLGQSAHLLVFTDQDDTLVLEGTSMQATLQAGKTNAIELKPESPGLYDLVIQDTGLAVGQINVITK